MNFNKIKYNPSVAGYLFKIFSLYIICGPAIVLTFFSNYSKLGNHFGGFIRNYFTAFIQSALISLPAILLTLIAGFIIYPKFKDMLLFKGALMFIHVFLLLTTFRLIDNVPNESITSSYDLIMISVFLIAIGSFVYKLEPDKN